MEWRTGPQSCLCSLGWQLQGDDLRLFVDAGTNLGTSPELRGARSAHAWEAHHAWFDWARVDDVLHSTATAERPAEAGKLNHYAPSFVYRYKRLPWITVQQRVDLTQRLVTLEDAANQR